MLNCTNCDQVNDLWDENNKLKKAYDEVCAERDKLKEENKNNNLEQLKQIKEEINNLSTRVFIGDSYACYGVTDKSAEDFKDEIMRILDKYILESNNLG